MTDARCAEQEVSGTFACPICGVDMPHSHSETEQKAYHEEQLRGQLHGNEGDGWIRTELRRPKARGWYLCRGVEVHADQFGKPEDIWHHHPWWSQLSWFKWVREAGRHGYSDSEIAEVLHFDPYHGGFTLRNYLGDAVVSGAESRYPVIARPKYWRELPGFAKAQA
jgi:hypothetical protein